MNFNISQATYDEVKDLVDKALTASSKAAAKKYIDRLDFLQRFGNYGGATNNIFSELVSSVKSASGSVSDKERLRSFAEQDLLKLQWQIEKKEDGC